LCFPRGANERTHVDCGDKFGLHDTRQFYGRSHVAHQSPVNVAVKLLKPPSDGATFSAASVRCDDESEPRPSAPSDHPACQDRPPATHVATSEQSYTRLTPLLGFIRDRLVILLLHAVPGNGRLPLARARARKLARRPAFGPRPPNRCPVGAPRLSFRPPFG
jgi:hypothetical protein